MLGLICIRWKVDCQKQRNEKLTAFYQCKKGVGVLEIADWIVKEYRGRGGKSATWE